ncbi:MAG: hypothetical protein GY816_24215 [Cytophagales bacterium]|nr:hypothetical protein [Cytophagales bacterium]
MSGGKQIKEQEQDSKLLTIENYKLIRDSPYVDELSKHTIRREGDKIWFSTKDGYTLFWLEINEDEPNGVKLRGLDGYGIRDREFRKYTANLIRKIAHTQ